MHTRSGGSPRGRMVAAVFVSVLLAACTEQAFSPSATVDWVAVDTLSTGVALSSQPGGPR